MSSIKTKLLIILLLIALVPLLILGVVIYKQTTDNLTTTTQDFLSTIVRSRNDALENYIDATEGLGASLAKTDALQQYVKLANKTLTPDEAAQFKAVKLEIDNLLYSFQEENWGKYHHIFLIAKDKKIAISPNHGENVQGSPSSHLNEDTSGNKWAMQALQQGITAISDYSSWIESDHSHQMLFYPLKDNLGTSQAAIGFELQIPYEQELLAEDIQLGETGQIFLTTDAGVPIVYKGINNQVPLNTQGIAEAKATGSSFGLRPNAAGVEVIDLHLKNSKYPWILVAEIEAQEAFRSLRAIQLIMLIGLIVTLITVTILSVLLSNLIVNPIQTLTKQMEEVSLGKLDIKIDNMKRKDEIGKLVQAFNRIIVSLKIAMRDYSQ